MSGRAANRRSCPDRGWQSGPIGNIKYESPELPWLGGARIHWSNSLRVQAIRFFCSAHIWLVVGVQYSARRKLLEYMGWSGRKESKFLILRPGQSHMYLPVGAVLTAVSRTASGQILGILLVLTDLCTSILIWLCVSTRRSEIGQLAFMRCGAVIIMFARRFALMLLQQPSHSIFDHKYSLLE